MLELCEHGLEVFPGEAGPRRDGQTGALEHLGRIAPGEEAPELVGADDEDGILESLGPEQLDRARMRVEPDVVVRKCRAAAMSP